MADNDRFRLSVTTLELQRDPTGFPSPGRDVVQHYGLWCTLGPNMVGASRAGDRGDAARIREVGYGIPGKTAMRISLCDLPGTGRGARPCLRWIGLAGASRYQEGRRLLARREGSTKYSLLP